MDIKISYSDFGVSLTFNKATGKFYSSVSNKDVVKYLKSVFTNKERFKNRFVDRFLEISNKLEGQEGTDPEEFDLTEEMAELMELYDVVKPFTYKEAFAISNDIFRAQVFGEIDIVEMIKNLGHTRIATDGIPVKHKVFSESGELLGMEEYDNIYEVHEVNCEGLGLSENAYAVRCWCTSTNKEHWLWIEDTYKDNPLEAIASTFRVHKKVIPYISEIKRQGDILLVETTEDVEVDEGDEIVPLTAEQYFDLLTVQT